MPLINIGILRPALKIKRLLINFSFRSSANLLSKAIGLITLPIIARALGPETYGDYNLVNIIIHYTTLPIGLLGLKMYGIREIAANRKDDSYVNKILSMQFLIAAVSIFISLVICYSIFIDKSLIFIAILLGYISVFAYSFDLEFFYVSRKDLVFPTMSGLAGQLFYLTGVILFIRKPDDFPLLILLSSLMPVISDIIQLKKYTSKFHPLKIKINIKELGETFKKTYKLGISQNLEGLVPTLPQLLLFLMAGSYALGIYSGGFRIYSVMLLFYVTFFLALAPYIIQMNNYERAIKIKYHLLILLLILGVSSLLGIILFFFGEPIVILILGKGFGDSVLIFKIISLSLIILKPVEMLLSNVLIYSGNEKFYLYGLLIQGLVILLSSYFLMKNFEVLGALYTIILSTVSSIIVLAYFYYKTELKSAG